MGLYERTHGFFHLMRPMEWSKSFGNMVIAAILAYYTYGVFVDPFLFILGFIAVALLWSGLYTLNDYTDWEKDAEHEIKKARPIPSGKVMPEIALLFAILLIVSSFGIGIYLWQSIGNVLFIVCLAAMLLNQIFYTMKPFNFKKLPVLDVISGSMINPIFRFYAGWVLFVATFNAPLLALLFVVGFQFGGYTLYRMGSKKHDEKLGYRSSVVTFGEKRIRRFSYVVMALGGLSFAVLVLNSKFALLENWGTLPLRYGWLAVLSVFLAPLYWSSMKNPLGMDMKKMYRLVYMHTMLFILGLIVIFLISP